MRRPLTKIVLVFSNIKAPKVEIAHHACLLTMATLEDLLEGAMPDNQKIRFSVFGAVTRENAAAVADKLVMLYKPRPYVRLMN